MSSQNKGKRKNRFKYYGGTKKAKGDEAKDHNELFENLVGFLVTCNNNEFSCLQESYNLLEELAEKLYGSFDADNVDGGQSDDEVAEEEDIEASIKKEIDRLKTPKKRRFIQVKTKCKNVLFIKSNDPRVVANEIVDELFHQIEADGRQTVCHISRMLPVAGTFKADSDKLDSRLEEMFDQVATKKPVTFGVQAKSRNNSDHPSDTTLMKRVTAVVRDKRPNWVVDLSDPNIFVIVNILQRSLCLSVLENFAKYSKYNPIEFHKKVKGEAAKKSNNVNTTPLVEEKKKGDETLQEPEHATALSNPTEVEIAS